MQMQGVTMKGMRRRGFQADLSERKKRRNHSNSGLIPVKGEKRAAQAAETCAVSSGLG
jgi:hypothetical protein